MIGKKNCLKIYSLLAFALLLASCGGTDNNTSTAIVIDQKYEHTNASGYLADNIYFYVPEGQEFVPSKPILVGVDLMFNSSSNAPKSITVNIRKTNLQNPILVTSTKDVGTSKAWSHFDFPAINVVPGDTYIIEVTSDDLSVDDAVSWWGDDAAGYPYGKWIHNSTVTENVGKFFRTYGVDLVLGNSISGDLRYNQTGN